MEGYEKNIGLKTIWLTLIRRFEYILFIFLPIALTTLIVTQFVLTKTYQSSVTISLNTSVTTQNFEQFKLCVNKEEVLNTTVEKLQAEKGIGISAGDISSGLLFTTPAGNSYSGTFSFQSSSKVITQPVMEVLSVEAVSYAKNNKPELASIEISSPASAPKKNSSENKYLLIGLAAGLVVALGIAFVDEIISDEVYDKKDVELLGCEAFELNVSKLNKEMVDGDKYGSAKI